MDEKLKLEIKTRSQEDCLLVGTKIHEQLVGNEDYINCHIVLNLDYKTNVVGLYIDKEVKEIPQLTIPRY